MSTLSNRHMVYAVHHLNWFEIILSKLDQAENYRVGLSAMMMIIYVTLGGLSLLGMLYAGIGSFVWIFLIALNIAFPLAFTMSCMPMRYVITAAAVSIMFSIIALVVHLV